MSNLNVIEAVRSYINRMIEDCGPTAKGLVMDKETATIVSLVYAQSEILQKEVFLFERIDIAGQKSLKHLTAICFLRPTEENIQSLIRELREPKYGNYFIYFTNFAEMSDIKRLAEADEFECVRVVQEFYADYLAVNPHLYSLNLFETAQRKYEWDETILRRTVQGLVSVLLSLRKKSAAIRYQKTSAMAGTLADKLSSTLRRQADFLLSNSNENSPTVVLIVDRREDAITPLLNQWTYQAMVHELLGIKNNRVSLKEVPGISKELEEVVMNAEYDEFYEKNLYSNFGEIATNIKELMEHFQEKHKSQSKIESIGDMKTFIENYPQFKKLSGTVSKHVTIISELSRLVGQYHLLEVSETEQNLVCQADHNEIVQRIKRLIKDEKIRDIDILRLLSLYALRYEGHASNEFNTLKYEAQKHRRLPERYLQFLQALLDYGGAQFRRADLFNNQTTMAITRQFIRGLRGVDNVYAQHVPLIRDLLEQLLKGKLKDTSYPNIMSKDQSNTSGPSTGAMPKLSEVIVYVIGGVTYEESYHIHQMNKQNARILLGGSSVQNFSTFIDEVLAASPTTLSAASQELLSSKRR